MNIEKSKKRFIIPIISIVWTISIMLLTPIGSVYPSDVGFYTSIFAGFIFYVFMSRIKFKYPKYEKSTKSK